MPGWGYTLHLFRAALGWVSSRCSQQDFQQKVYLKMQGFFNASLNIASKPSSNKYQEKGSWWKEHDCYCMLIIGNRTRNTAHMHEASRSARDTRTPIKWIWFCIHLKVAFKRQLYLQFLVLINGGQVAYHFNVLGILKYSCKGQRKLNKYFEHTWEQCCQAQM